MVQNYQNEIAPIFYYGISTKTNEKDLKIPNLQPPDWKNPYWMSLYLLLTLTPHPRLGSYDARQMSNAKQKFSYFVQFVQALQINLIIIVTWTAVLFYFCSVLWQTTAQYRERVPALLSSKASFLITYFITASNL